MDSTGEESSERDERLGEVVFACLQAAERGRPWDRAGPTAGAGGAEWTASPAIAIAFLLKWNAPSGANSQLRAGSNLRSRLNT